MRVLAITREMGSLGSFIGLEVARRLGWEYVRDDITREAAREYDVDEERLIGAVEERPGFLEALTLSARRYQPLVAAEVLDVASRGNVVIMGRWSTLLLQRVRHAARVRVCASRPVRVARIAERLGIGAEDARRRVEDSDEGVRARIRQVFEVEWEDPLQYDLTLVTDRIEFETAVGQVLHLLDAPEFQPSDDSRRVLAGLALEARVRAALKAREDTSGVEIEIRADAGRVALAGTVRRRDELEAALRVVRAVEGVHTVVDDVRVIDAPPR